MSDDVTGIEGGRQEANQEAPELKIMGGADPTCSMRPWRRTYMHRLHLIEVTESHVAGFR